MNHYKRLADLEKNVIDFECYVAILEVMANGLTNSDPSKIQTAMHGIVDIGTELSNSLNHSFDRLFSEIRESGHEIKDAPIPGKEQV